MSAPIWHTPPPPPAMGNTHWHQRLPTADEHLGRWFKREIFDYHELKAADIAESTGISASKLSKFLNQKCDLDNDLAIRLGHNFALDAFLLVSLHAQFKLQIDLVKHHRDLAIFNPLSVRLTPEFLQAQKQADDAKKTLDALEVNPES